MLKVRHYTIVEKVWSGHNSVVYRSVRDDGQTPVLLKTPISDYPSSREIARIEREHALLLGIHDKHVVKALGLERVPHSVVLATEDIGGQPLNTLIASRKLDIQAKLNIACALAEALVVIRRANVLHKDIKPANIAHNVSTGETQLFDFGLATGLARETQRFVRPEALEGTLSYISPEQTGRMNRDIDHRSDLYSAGVTLYELFTGELPFRTTDALEMVHSHIARVPVAPHERVPAIPEVVSRIVMKLISKEPDDRYQTPQGLVADLQLCLQQWREAGTIEPFAPGQRDVSDVLRIPQKLYGREAETALLLSTFERARQNQPMLMLIGGPAGSGKSVLVHEVHGAIARNGGDFISGKFDQLHRGLPFASFSQAFREVVRQLLTMAPADLEIWKKKLLKAVDPNGQILIDVLPDLKQVIGPQAPVSPLAPSEAQNRFALTFQSFVEVFCAPGSPLVVFLDDVQWADSGSLWLLQHLLTNMKGRPLLVIAAYRDQEVDGVHPLRSTLRDLEKSGIQPAEIQLGNISQASVRSLISDALPGADREQLDALAEQLFVKTHGSPLFLTQLLLEWEKTGLLRLGQETGKWTWDTAEIAKAPVAENVADFLVKKLKTLAPNVQALVSLAAAIGHQFDWATLSTISNRTLAELSAALWPALESGLILPLDTDYGLVLAAAVAPRSGEASDLQANFRFLHDRVQQAAYSLIEAGEKAMIHLRIGARLREKLADPPEPGALFVVVDHMNAGAGCITDPAARLDLARLNLAAGETAKAATAFDAAVRFFDAGSAVLDEGSWSEHYELTFKLHRERAECLFMSRQFERADAEVGRLLDKVRLKRERADLHRLRTIMYMMQSRVPEALAAGREGLALFDITLPDALPDILQAFLAELAVIDKELETRPLESLVDAPRMGPDEQVVAAILTDILPAIFWLNPPLIAILTVKQVSLALAHGISAPNAFGLASFGLTLIAFTGRVVDALRFGQVGLRIGEKLGEAAHLASVYNVIGCYGPCATSFRQAAEWSKAAITVGLEAGSLYFASNATCQRSAEVYAMGEPLDRVQEEIDSGFAVLERTKDVGTPGALWFLRQMVACLQGRTSGRPSMNDDTFDEAARVAYEQSISNTKIIFLYNLYKIELAAWFGEPESFLEKAMACEAVAAEGLGTLYHQETLFYGSLVLTARHASAPAEEQARIMEMLASIQTKLDVFVKGCPENYEHRQLMIVAEIERIKGDFQKAHDLYDEAIAKAQANGFVQHVALANELCGRMHVSRGRPKIALGYILDARSTYQRWGADGKVRQLEENYPELLDNPAFRVVSPSATYYGQTTTSVSTTNTKSMSLDVPTIIKAAQALSGEISFDKLMLRMMSVVAENAGAEKGVLILPTGDGLCIVAEVSADAGVSVQREPSRLAGHKGVSHGIVHYVERTHESVIIDDAAVNGLFTRDADIVSRKPRSILCMPLLHQGQLKGILYLENNLTAGSFTVNRTMLLSALCSQMAISVENAHVYANLEALVEVRTRDLREAQARVVKLEKQATEVRMAGGFAHEMRNALASAQMRMALVYRRNGDRVISVCDDSGDLLKQLFLLSKQAMLDDQFQQAAGMVQNLYGIQKKLVKSLSGMSLDIERALKVTGEILEYSRQGFETRGDARTDVRAWIDGVLRVIEEELSEAHITVTVEAPADCIVLGNENHLFSILSNLVFNARDAVTDVTDRERLIDIRARVGDDALVVEVADSGVGIRAEDLSRVFEPFFSTKPNTGTGLGLGMVEKLVTLYKGTIEFVSEVDRGTTVTMCLPILAP